MFAGAPCRGRGTRGACAAGELSRCSNAVAWPHGSMARRHCLGKKKQRSNSRGCLLLRYLCIWPVRRRRVQCTGWRPVIDAVAMRLHSQPLFGGAAAGAQGHGVGGRRLLSVHPASSGRARRAAFSQQVGCRLTVFQLLLALSYTGRWCTFKQECVDRIAACGQHARQQITDNCDSVLLRGLSDAGARLLCCARGRRLETRGATSAPLFRK
jgi:hypothetical protein